MLGPMLFHFRLVAGLIYELKSGALEWEKWISFIFIV